MKIKGKHYYTTSQFISECLRNGEDIEYIIDGLSEIGVKRDKALVYINYVQGLSNDNTKSKSLE